MTLLRPTDAGPSVEPPFCLIDPDGNPTGDDRFPPPDLDVDAAQAALRLMLRTRRLDEELVRLQRQGQLALYPQCAGQEAAQVGTALALRETDWIVPQYRELGVFLTRGIDPAGIGHMWRGTTHGGYGLIERRVTPIAIPIGTQALHGVGSAMASQRLGDDAVTVVYCGDGATSTGDVHEAMNFAAVYDAPCVFVVQNNQWAISVPVHDQMRASSVVARVPGYGMAGASCDGNDVLASHAVMTWAVDHARRGQGPVLVEAITYRMGSHTTADDATRYRESTEVEAWALRDPIERYRTYLRHQGRWTEADDVQSAEQDDRAATALRDAIFDAPPADALDLFANVVAAPSPELLRQRAQLADELGVEL